MGYFWARPEKELGVHTFPISFTAVQVHMLFHEKAIYATWPPNTKEAQRLKHKAHKSNLLVRELTRELTYRNAVQGSSKTKQS